VAFIYAVGSLQTAFALHDFYSIFCLPGNREFADLFLGAQEELRRFGFMWITIPLSGASGALLFHPKPASLRLHDI
jgi:hypothetical protein